MTCYSLYMKCPSQDHVFQHLFPSCLNCSEGAWNPLDKCAQLVDEIGPWPDESNLALVLDQTLFPDPLRCKNITLYSFFSIMMDYM